MQRPMRTVRSRRHPPAFPGPEITQLRFAKIFLSRAKFWPLALKSVADAPIKSRKALFLLRFARFETVKIYEVYLLLDLIFDLCYIKYNKILIKKDNT